MSVEENKAIVRRHVEEWNNKNSAVAIDELHASDYASHGPSGEEGDLDGLRRVFREHENYSEYHYTITKLFGEGDEVVVILDDQHTEAATGQLIACRGVHIYRLAGGKIHELWWLWSPERPI